ncbi:MAG: hypothetical protein SynsKO_04770 [Synoicihabitans sp.]
MKNTLLKTLAASAVVSLALNSAAYAADEDKPAGPPSREEMIQKFDANGDGQLDQAEREAVREYMAANRPEGGQRGRGGPGGGGRGGNPMAQFDTDGDGKLSPAERKAADPIMRERTESNERAMGQFDKDGDGKLNDKEWAAARKTIVQRMGQARGGRGGDGEGRQPRRQRGE